VRLRVVSQAGLALASRDQASSGPGLSWTFQGPQEMSFPF
jgi:hypothetical protein